MTPQTGVFVITKSQNYPKRRIFAFQKCGRKIQGLHMHSGAVKTSGLRGSQSAIFWTTFLGVANDTSGPAANTSANMISTDRVSGYIFGVRKFRNPRRVYAHAKYTMNLIINVNILFDTSTPILSLAVHILPCSTASGDG